MERLGISTCICGNSLGVNQLEIMERLGIEHFELGLHPFPLPLLNNKNLVKEIEKYLKNSNLKCRSLHSVYDGKNDFSLFTGKEQDSSLSQIKKYIDLASRLGADKVVVHPSGKLTSEAERPKRLSQCKEGLNKLGNFAKSLEVRLAVENLPREWIGNCSQEMREIISGFVPEIIGVCVDVNHIFKERIDEFIKALGKRIITTHIADNDGIDDKHWLPMKGVINWQKVIFALKSIDYHGVFMYEVKIKSGEFKEKIETIKENYRELKSKFYKAEGR